MGIQAVTMFNSFPKWFFNGDIDLSKGSLFISMINTNKGAPAADDDRHFYQITGRYGSGYNPLPMIGTKFTQEGDDLVFTANNVTFYRSDSERDYWGYGGAFDVNPICTHITIWYARPGSSSPGAMLCFFPVNWGSMFGTGQEKITWNVNGIFRCKIVGS